MSNQKILLADDEARMRKLVGDYLKRAGYQVIEACNGREAIEIFTEQPDISLVILDVMMPEYDGWAVCREIRSHKAALPIVMLTARGEERDELFGFELGADEYISKPFSPNILVARVQALIRRSSDGGKRVLNCRDLEINEDSRTVCMDGETLPLTPKEYELLAYLVDNAGLALSREQILNAVWQYDYFGDSRTVDTHIKRLRSKLGEPRDYIQTVRGFGYRFEVE